jgi:hypothetical protein
MNIDTINLLALGWIGLAFLLVPFQLRVTAPYGRHQRPGWGRAIPSRVGWIIMEVVSPLVFVSLFLIGGAERSQSVWIVFGLWVLHYIHRSLIFPFRTRSHRQIPLLIVASAILFNTVNASLNGYYLGEFATGFPEVWESDPRFLVGLGLFLGGAAINVWADYRLIALRKNRSATDYGIPRGGLFNHISCPNHLGEIVEWAGFAVMCWNLPALSFAIWTAANLMPRSLSHHRWYRQTLAGYPDGRKAVIPYVV